MIKLNANVFLWLLIILFPFQAIGDEGILDLQNRYLKMNKENANLVADLWVCDHGEIASKIDRFGLSYTVVFVTKNYKTYDDEQKQRIALALFSYMEGYVRGRMELRKETVNDKLLFCNQVVKQAEEYR
jgi:hypothetical protein